MLGYDMTWATFAVVEAANAMIIFTGWCPIGKNIGVYMGLIWDYMGFYMASYYELYMALYGFIWVYMALYGFIIG